ncbi:MAG TPA: hypothetical protein VGK43_01360 [Solirubrobacterales bacterium]
MTEPRSTFTARLEAEASGATLTLDLPGREWPVVAVVRRGDGRFFLALPKGYGITLHRKGGVSFPGLPSSGGTSILWGACRERVRSLGKDHRAIELGPVGIYIGSDF